MARPQEAQSLVQLAHSKRHVVRRPAADVRAATIVALQSGGQIVQHPFIPDAPQHVVQDLAGDCLRPLRLEQQGEGHFQGVKCRSDDAEWQPNRTLEQKLRCRQCSACLRYRRRMWQRRAVREHRTAVEADRRSWFVTLTVEPGERFRAFAETRQRVGPAWDRLSPRDHAEELLRTLSPLVTRWLMRLRKAGARFRYLLVSEPHRDQFPHFHLIMHEVDALHPLRKEKIEGKWPHGLTHARLVKDVRQAFYVAKYLGKTPLSRLRASQHYGDGPASRQVATDGRTLCQEAMKVMIDKARSELPPPSTAPEGVTVGMPPEPQECERPGGPTLERSEEPTGGKEVTDNVLQHNPKDVTLAPQTNNYLVSPETVLRSIGTDRQRDDTGPASSAEADGSRGGRATGRAGRGGVPPARPP